MTLQQLTGKTWHTLGHAGKVAYTVSKALPVGAYTLRVAKAFSTTVAAGVSKAFSVTVTAPPVVPPTPNVTTTAIPAATVGKPYTTVLAASRTTPPYTWSATGVPAGLS